MMSEYFKNGHIELPLFVDDGDPVLDTHGDAYQKTSLDNWRLSDAAREQIAKLNAETDEMIRTANAETAAIRKSHQRDRAKLDDTIVGSSLDTALRQHGVALKFVPAVAAMLAKHHKVIVDDEQCATIDGSSADDFVSQWVQTPDAAAFLEAPSTPVFVF